MHVQSRTSTQARSHAQKFFVKLERKGLDYQKFLDGLDINNLNNMASELLEFEEDDDNHGGVNTPSGGLQTPAEIETSQTKVGSKRLFDSRSETPILQQNIMQGAIKSKLSVFGGSANATTCEN